MNTDQAQKPLRVWPGVALVVLQWLAMFVLPKVFPDAMIYGLFGGLGAGLLVLIWWTFFSRAPWLERLGITLLTILIGFAARPLVVDKSIATAMMGFMILFIAIPLLSLALAAGAVISRRLSAGPRRVTMVGSVLLACALLAVLRTNGISGDGAPDFAWRWTKSHEEKLVAKAEVLPVAAPAVVPVAAKITEEPIVAHLAKEPPVMVTPAVSLANWPGFRGPMRDGIAAGTHIATDWSAAPPMEMWRKPIGPGWSSFAVRGDLIYTQEQRGEDELVTCYNASTGNPVWAHRDVARFWEANAGAGPRGTPTLHGSRVYTFGATGILNALDASSGAMLWSRNAANDTHTKTPGWGFSSSPLVLDDMLVIATSGKLAAYDLATGAPRWVGPEGGDSYSSPQVATIDGVQQILLTSATGVMSVAPADGALLWKYAWPSDTRIMQPTVMADGDVLISAGDAMGGVGVRRIAVKHGADGWTTEERWTSTGLKPSFNDFAPYDGHVYGFDGGILVCVDLKDGKRNWKGGRYGHGQFVLLRDQGLLVVLSEEGDVALVKAAPDQFTELGKIHALEGKTWNHPVVAGDRLLVRNGDEMVGFRLR
jgi:outer membrane protein assembly factor BamB